MEGLAPVPDDGAHQASGTVLEVRLGPSLPARKAKPRGTARAQHPAAALAEALLRPETPRGAPGVVLLSLKAGVE